MCSLAKCDGVRGACSLYIDTADVSVSNNVSFVDYLKS
jgi:hypothetical protein